MRRREFIGLIFGAAATCPLVARAQQPERMRRVGLFMNLAPDDPQSAREISAFVDALKQRGWTPGSNLQIEYRWGAGDHDLDRKYAPELVAFSPDVLLVTGGTTVGILQQATRSIPIVFVEVTDPVNRGFGRELGAAGR